MPFDALAVAAHVRSNDVEAGLSQRVDLTALGVRDFREGEILRAY